VRPSQIVEAVLFASDAPLKAGEIARADESLDEDVVEAALDELRSEYDESDRAFHIAELGEGFQLLTRSEFSTYLERFDTVPKSSRLSGPALETLAIVAYRQPISRVEVEYIRGVASAGVLRTLQDRALIDVVGRGEGLGRPYLYGTTQEFLNHFGFGSLEELPRTEELPVVLRDPQPLEAMEEDGEGSDGDQRSEQGDLLDQEGRTAEQGEGAERDAAEGAGGSIDPEDGGGDGRDEADGNESGDEVPEEEESAEEAVARVLEGIPREEWDEVEDGELAGEEFEHLDTRSAESGEGSDGDESPEEEHRSA